MGQIIVNTILILYFSVAGIGFIITLVSPWYVHQSFDNEQE